MKKSLVVLSFILLTCCQGRQNVNDDNKNEIKTNDHLIGTWNNGFDSASFIITKDSIYDFEHFKWTTFIQNGDTATFYYLPDEEFKTRLYKIHEDTLIHELGVSKTKYWRLGKLTDKSLKGVWTDGSGPNASVRIEEDSIYDVEHFERSKYEIKGDSLIIFYEDKIFKAKITKLDSDSLIYVSEYGETKMWRFKN